MRNKDDDNNQQMRASSMRAGTFDYNQAINNIDLSLSNSKLQFFNMDSILNDQSVETSSSVRDFSLTVIESEKLNFNKMQNEMDDRDLINLDDSIFKFLATEDKLQKSSAKGSRCSMCSCEFTLIKKKHQCLSKFCTNIVCKYHSKKKRADPQDSTSAIFHRICDVCEDKYVKMKVQESYIERRKELDAKLQLQENRSSEIIMEVKLRQEAINKFKCQKQDQQNEIMNNQTQVTYRIQKINQETGQIKREILNIQKKHKDIDDQIFMIEHRIHQKEQTIYQKQRVLSYDSFNRIDEESQKRKQITAIEQDIKQTQHILEQIEKKIAEKKIIEAQRINLNEIYAADYYENVNLQNTDEQEQEQEQKVNQERQSKNFKVDQRITKDDTACKECRIF